MAGEDSDVTRTTVVPQGCPNHSGMEVGIRNIAAKVDRLEGAVEAQTRRMGDGDSVFTLLKSELQHQKDTLSSIKGSVDRLVAEGVTCGQELIGLVTRVKDVEVRIERIEREAKEAKSFRKGIFAGALTRVIATIIGSAALWLLYSIQRDLNAQMSTRSATPTSVSEPRESLIPTPSYRPGTR